MQTTLTNLKSLLRESVCEVVFIRRRPKAGKPAFRRMLCTLDENILNTTNGRLSLNYKPSSGLLPYNAEAKNLLPVWDVFMQGWRMISMDNCDLVKTVKEEDFWKYYNETLLTMSVEQKLTYMDT